MKYVITTVLDQTIGFLTPEGSYTTVHAEALLFNNPAKADIALLKEHELIPTHYSDGSPIDPERREWLKPWIDEVQDEVEFKKREDTW